MDPDGAGPESGYFEFTNDNSPYALVSEGGGGVFLGDPGTYTSPGRVDPDGNTDADTDYVLSGGPICFDAFGVPISCADAGAVSGPFEHNLGADNAAYAVVFPELNNLLNNLFANGALDLTQYTLHVDFRFGCDPTLFGTDPDDPACAGGDWGKNINNGYEQLFISTLARTQVPAPGVLALFAAGLLGLGAARRRG